MMHIRYSVDNKSVKPGQIFILIYKAVSSQVVFLYGIKKKFKKKLKKKKGWQTTNICLNVIVVSVLLDYKNIGYLVICKKKREFN